MTPTQLDREMDRRDLEEFVRGADKHNATKRARRAYVVASILRERGIATDGADNDMLESLARTELMRMKDQPVAPAKRFVLGRGTITEEQARSMPRFEFIAHWLVVVTRKKDNRGPLGLYVKRSGKRWQIVSPVGGGTVTYQTTDPALLFDYARRGQLGTHIRDAEDFRGLAFQSMS